MKLQYNEHFLYNTLEMQPLVDNCVLHGFKDGIHPDHYIRINGFRSGQGYVVEVEDNGVGFQKGIAWSGVGGLSTVNHRLKLLFGDAGRIHIIENKPGTGTKVQIHLPSNHKQAR